MNTKLPCATLVWPAVLLACVAASPLAAQGIITTLAGADWVFPGDGRPALEAPLGGVSGLSLDDNGELFLADPDNLILMRVDPDGTLEVIAGTGIRVTAGDEGPALTASLRGPAKLTRDVMGNLYFIDIDPNVGVRLRQLTGDGLMAHFAGRGPFGFGGDGGPAIEALFRFPEDLTAGPGGVYVADTGNDRIRLISNGGMISTFAGNGDRGFSGEGKPATLASLNRPSALALNSSNELFISDNGNRRIRKIGPKGLITTVAGTGENALVEGHRNEDLTAVDLADLVNRAHIGVVERRRRPRLLDKTLLGILVARKVRQQELQHDRPIKVEVDGFIDRPHAALAELRGHLEVGDLSADHGGSAETPDLQQISPDNGPVGPL